MQQPFLIVFPLFISVFIVRVLPRVILAPVALLVLLFMNRWLDPRIEVDVAGQGPAYAHNQQNLPAPTMSSS